MSQRKRGLSLYPYLPYALSSFVLSLGPGALFNYFRTGQTIIDGKAPIHWPSAIILFAIFISLDKLLPRYLKCFRCNRKGSADHLVSPEGKNLCREHLIEEFRRYFISFTSPMVVFYPSLEDKQGSFTYQYQVWDDMREKQKEDEIGQLVRRAFDKIRGTCEKCSGQASIAYFGPGTFRWSIEKVGGVNWHVPKYEEITVSPQVLCPNCVIDEVVYSLEHFQDNFGDPIVVPHKGPGILLPFET